MEDKSKELIAGSRLELSNAKQLSYWIDGIDRHVLTGYPEYFYIESDEALRDFAKLVGHEKVTSDQIIAYYYSATAYERLDMQGESMHFGGEATITGLQERLADAGVNLEHPNDYRVKLAVALDAETMVVYENQMNAETHICADCARSTDPDIIETLELNGGDYGCGHINETYDSRNGTVIMKRLSSHDTLGELVHMF